MVLSGDDDNTSSIDLSSHQLEVGYSIATFGGIISLICSLSTIAIIFNMKKVSGYVWLVFNLAIATTFIDIGQIMYSGNKLSTDHILCQFSGILLLYGNMSAGMWTVAISLSVAFIVIKTIKFNITNNIVYIASVCMLIPFSLSLAALTDGQIKYTAQGTCFLPKSKVTTVSILYDTMHYIYFICDIILYMIIWFFVHKMRRDIKNGSISVRDIGSDRTEQFDFRSSIFDLVNTMRNSFRPSLNNNNLATPTTLEAAGKRRVSALEILVSRLIWYPVVLILVEIFRDLDRTGKSTNFTLHILHLLTNVSQGTAYFIIFLAMQPKAYGIFVSLISCSYIGKEQSSTEVLNRQVSWIATKVDAQRTTLNSNLLTADEEETSRLMKQMDEDALAEEIEVTNDVIIETLRASYQKEKTSATTRASLEGSVRIEDNNMM